MRPSLENARRMSGPVFEGMTEDWAEVDGTTIRYLAGGAGPPVLLLHGVAGFCFSWRQNFPALIRQFRVIAPDLPGVGYSERCNKIDVSLSGLARYLFGLLDAVQVHSTHIVASSHGGAVAMQMAAQYPERIRSMALAAPLSPYAKQYRKRIGFVGSWAGNTFVKLAPWAAIPLQRYAIGRMYGDPKRMPPGTADGYCRPLRIPGTIPHLLQILRRLPADLQKLRSEFAAIADVPTLLIWGGKDGVVEIESGEELRRHFRHAQLVVLPGAGHLPYEEVPEQFNGPLIDFLAAQQARRPQVV